MNAELNELLDRLVRTPSEIAKLLSGVSPASTQIRPNSEEFSILENVCHLRDIEVEGYTVRIRRLLEEDNPQLEDIDGARLAIERDYNSQQLDDVIESFTTARQQNVKKLSTTSESDFERLGSLEGVGEITLRSLLNMMAEHDEGHLDELRRASRLVKSPSLDL